MKSGQMLMMHKVFKSIVFTTNKNGTFNPTITTSDASVARWSVSGESDQITNTPSFTLTGTDRTVTLSIADLSKIDSLYLFSQNIKGTLDISSLVGLTDFRAYSNPLLTSIVNPTTASIFTAYAAYLCNLTGTLDLSGLTGLGGILNLSENPLLTSITNPISLNNFSTYSAASCNITGTLDLSGLTGLGGNFRAFSNPLLTSIVNPTSTITFTEYTAYLCNLTGTLDLSGLTGLGGNFRVYSNSNLTSITNPISLNNFSTYSAASCNITGTLDLSGLTGLGGGLFLQSNTNLTDVTNPVCTNNFIQYWIYGCSIGVLNWANLSGSISDIRIEDNGFTSAESDENIVSIDTNINITTTLNIAGTNGSLTDGSVTGFDGITAKNNLVAAGVSVTFN